MSRIEQGSAACKAKTLSAVYLSGPYPRIFVHPFIHGCMSEIISPFGSVDNEYECTNILFMTLLLNLWMCIQERNIWIIQNKIKLKLFCKLLQQPFRRQLIVGKTEEKLLIIPLY